MPKSTGLGDRLFVGGRDLSGDINSLQRISGGPAPLDLTDITQSAHDREGGLRNGGIDFTAYFDKQTAQAHLTLSTLPLTDRVVTYCRGTTFGGPAASCVAKQINYDPTRATDGSLTFAVSAQSNGYGLEWGQLLTSGIRTDTGATIGGSSIDGGASTSLGFQAYLHVVAFTGTDATISVRMDDNSSFTSPTTIKDFVVAAAPYGERYESSRSQLVERYVKVNTTTSAGFTNLQFLLVFTRNDTSVVF